MCCTYFVWFTAPDGTNKDTLLLQSVWVVVSVVAVTTGCVAVMWMKKLRKNQNKKLSTTNVQMEKT